ncbi:MAG: hypothetical protein V4473_02365 [Patescibacteria group bacterium]
MDQEFEELIGVDSARAFNFFSTSLREALGTKRLNVDQMLYVASVLAHYSQTSRFDTESMPFTTELVGVLEYYMFQQPTVNSEILEIGGSQVLLFAGFFRDQMRRRHNVEWYDQIGQSLYDRASRFTTDRRKQKLFDGLAESFPAWALVCSDMSRRLRENRFVINVD